MFFEKPLILGQNFHCASWELFQALVRDIQGRRLKLSFVYPGSKKKVLAHSGNICRKVSLRPQAIKIREKMRHIF